MLINFLAKLTGFQLQLHIYHTDIRVISSNSNMFPKMSNCYFKCDSHYLLFLSEHVCCRALVTDFFMLQIVINVQIKTLVCVSEFSALQNSKQMRLHVQSGAKTFYSC